MDWQTLFNLILGVSSALFGFLVRTLWDAVTELRRDLHRLERDLPERYFSKLDFETWVRRLDARLERIEEKIDGKQDRRP
jgi:hypothetical protein